MGDMKLRQALDEYKNVYLAARNYSQKTRVEYSYDVGEFVAFLEKSGFERVGELGVPLLERYLAELDNWGVAPDSRTYPSSGERRSEYC